MAKDAVWGEVPDGAVATLSARGWRKRIPYILSRGRPKVVWTGSAVLLSAFIVLATLINATLSSAEQRKRAEAWHLHSFNVLLVVGDLNAHLNAALRGERGYLITQDESFLEPYELAKVAVPKAMARLLALTSDNPRQLALSVQLEERTVEFFRLMELAVDKVRGGETEEAFQLVRSGVGKDRAVLVFDILRQIESEEERLLEERMVREERAVMRSNIIRFSMIGFGVVLVLLATGVSLMALDGHVRALDANIALARIATIDALTSLPNRRNFLEELEKVAARSGRSGAPYSVAMFDIDCFKKVNDTHGHPAGDEVLRDVARIMRGSIREGDVAARLGGEEFALLMPDTALADAGIVCERVRKAVEAHGFVLPSGLTISATISAGVAQAEGAEAPSILILRADTALYAAKHEGRNRVNFAGHGQAMLNPTV